MQSIVKFLIDHVTLTLASLGAKFVTAEELSQQLRIKIIYWF